MSNIQVSIPEELYNFLRVLGYQKKDIETELLEDTVLQLYAKHIISIGKAASILELSVQAFRETLLKRNLPVEYFTKDVYEEDSNTIKSIKGSSL